MAMTITEKILAKHAGLDSVEPGQLIMAKVDMVLGNDITAPIAIREFETLGLKEVFDPDKICLVPDHFTPNKDIDSARQTKVLRDFAAGYGIRNYFEIGRCGIEHALLPEKGLVLPGDLVIGADSHTCTYGALGAFATGVGSTDMAAAMALGEAWFRVPETIKVVFRGKPRGYTLGKDLILYLIGQIGVDGARYKAIELTGDGITSLSMDSRFSMCNMAIEAGAKNGIMIPDDTAFDYAHERTSREFHMYASDPDARYEKVYEFDASSIEPQVAFPHSPANAKPISKAAGITIDQVVLGSCTNGRMEDLRMAASLLKGKKVHPKVRLIVIPATQAIYLQAMKEGLLRIFVEAGAAVSTPTCGPCLGGHMGILAEEERAVATTNRNFVGRMGHPTSEVYLAGPAVAAASAITGYLASPEEVH